jgi:TPR repeat protein
MRNVISEKISLAALAAMSFILVAPFPAQASLDPTQEFNAMQVRVEKPGEIPVASKADAEYNLGVKYYNAGDKTLATGWFRKAAEHGEVQGQSHLGLAYELGLGVGKDYKEALKWYGLAAAQGDKDARCGLGRLYAHGQGAKRDDAVAAKWFRLAAGQGQPEAQYALGLFYQSGRGVEKDGGEAYFWLALASKALDGAMKARDAVAKHLTEEQLQSLRMRLLQWKPVDDHPSPK